MYLKDSVKLGERLLVWLDRFKIALAERDSTKIEALLEETPTFSTREEMQEALYLLQSAKVMVSEFKDITALQMQKLQKSRDYMNALGASKRGNFTAFS